MWQSIFVGSMVKIGKLKSRKISSVAAGVAHRVRYATEDTS